MGRSRSSKEIFSKAEEKLIDKPITIRPFLEKLQGIFDEISTPLEKGIAPPVTRILKPIIQKGKPTIEPEIPTLRANLEGTGFGDSEIKIITNLIQKLNGIEKFTTKELLNLKRNLQKGGFYKGDGQHKGSDRLVTIINKEINKAIGEVDSSFAKATKKASEDIEFLDKLGFNILGRGIEENIEITSSKLLQLSNAIDNPNKKEATKKLLQILKNRVGYDLENELLAFKAAQQTMGDIPGISSPWQTANQTLTRFLVGTAENAGKFRDLLLK